MTPATTGYLVVSRSVTCSTSSYLRVPLVALVVPLVCLDVN